MRPDRRVASLVSFVLAGSLLVSACAGGASTPPPKTEAPKAAPKAAATSAPAAPKATEAKAAAPAAASPAAAAKMPSGTFKIGIHGDKTKAASYYTKTFNEGVDLAIEEAVKSGMKVETVFEDDENNPAVAAQKVQKFAADGVHFIFSNGSSATGRQAQKIAEELKVPIGSPANVVVDLTVPHKKYYFRTGQRDDYAAQGLIAYMKAKFPQVAVVRDGTETGLSAAETVVKQLRDAGIEPTTIEQINLGATDATAQANKVKATGANAVVLVGADITLMAVYVKAHATAGNQAPILGTQILGIPPFDELTKGFNDTIQFLDTMDPARPEVQEIEKRMKAKYGPNFELSATGVQGYEWTRLVLDAMQRAGEPDREKIRDAMENTKNWPTAIGAKGAQVTFAPDNHDMFKNSDWVVIRKFQNGKYGPAVWPEK